MAHNAEEERGMAANWIPGFHFDFDVSDDIFHLLENFKNSTVAEPLPLDAVDGGAELEIEPTTDPIAPSTNDEARAIESATDPNASSTSDEALEIDPATDPNAPSASDEIYRGHEIDAGSVVIEGLVGLPHYDLGAPSFPVTALPVAATTSLVEQLQSVDRVEPVPVWIQIAGTDCSFCVVLREMVYANDLGSMKMHIHGGLGVFYHALLEVYNNAAGTVALYLSDFSGCSHRAVKQFLIEQAQLRQQEGFFLINGTMNEFYDALCAGMGVPSSNTAAGSSQKKLAVGSSSG